MTSPIPTPGAATDDAGHPPVAIVTGGGSGIGAAIAAQWTSHGGQILVTDVDQDAARAVADGLGEAAIDRRVDVRCEDDIVEAVDAALEKFGRVDAVFANAGATGVTGSIESTARADWDDTLELLLTGNYLTIKHAVRAMRPLGRGSIVVTGSVAGMHGGLGPHAYTAAKHALRGLVESVAVEISPSGLRINAVAPGGVATALSTRLVGGDQAAALARLVSRSSAGIATTADDVAAAAVFLAGPGARRINGATLVIDGGDAVLPHAGLPFYQDPA